MRRPALLSLVIASVALAGCGIADPYQGDRTISTPTSPSALWGTSRQPASEDTAPPSAVQRVARDHAKRAAHTFLDGYLPYSYGQRPGTEIRRASPALRRALIGQPPRVSAPRSHVAPPRLRSIRVSGLSRHRVYLLAQITDGQATYATSLTVQRQERRWLVREVR